MKIKLLFVIGLLSFLGYGQINKMETFLTGTKVLFYPNQCGNAISEAQGKLSFCDRANNLGVVERSYGLNYRGVTRMLANYNNQDELFITNNGLSIRNTNGTWDNVPNMAIPLWGTQYIPTLTNGMALPNGNIILFATNSGSKMHTYNRIQKTITSEDFPNNKYPQQLIYDTDRNLTWVFAISSNTTYLFTYDGITLTEISNLGNVNINTNSTTLVYKNNHIYVGNSNGLYKIDVSDYTNSVPITHYNSTTTPSLPFNRVNDLQFDTNGVLWMAQGDNNDGGIVKFDTSNETYEIYQLARPDNTSVNQKFQDFAIDNNGVLWASSNDYSGLAKLTFAGTTPNWINIPKTDLATFGVPITYNPNNIYFRNHKFYFTTVDGSSGNSNNFEVIINDNGNWSGRNDNETGNLSQRMNSRFTKSLPDDNGGVWWFNRHDDVIVYRDKDDNHQNIILQNLGNSAAIDVDNKAIVKGGSPYEIRKIDFPNTPSIQNVSNEAIDMQRVGNQVWIFDRTHKKIDVYENNTLITTYNLDGTDHSTYSQFAVDDDNNIWFAKNSSGQNVRLKKFDTSTLISTVVEIPANISSFKKILATTNNGIWVIGNRGVLYYQNGNNYLFLAADHSEIYNIRDATVDSNGKLYLLNNDLASITTLENSTTTAVLTNTKIEGNNSVLPSLKQYRPSTITIDSEGSIWTHASQNAFKLVDDDFAVTYRRQSTLAVSDQTLISSNIEAFPNPTSQLLNIRSTYPIKTIRIYSILGKKVLEVKNTNTIDLTVLSSGLYIAKIFSNNTSISKRILKQ